MCTITCTDEEASDVFTGYKKRPLARKMLALAQVLPCEIRGIF